MDLQQLAARLVDLPPYQQVKAAHALKKLYGDQVNGEAMTRRKLLEKYAAFDGDPWRLVRDVFGYHLTPQQDNALELMVTETRLLLPSANNTGKTFLLGLYGVYVLICKGSVLNEEGLPQGARVLLMAPDHATIRSTIYGEMLVHAARAEARGHKMPGRRSENSVLWRLAPQWEVEAFSPPERVAVNVASNVSGRHSRVQVALIEEGQGVPEAEWRGAEGMCSSEGNQIISSFNPTESSGPTFTRADQGYKVLHLSAFDHPNVLTRSSVVIDAISFRVVDDRVRSQCQDRGARSQVAPDENFADFLYALPKDGAEERGPREDGILGHPDAEVRVYRPGPVFQPQVLGQWPLSLEGGGPVSPGAWDAAVARWKQRAGEPRGIPSRIGVDCAREGDDDTCCAPIWGDTADVLIRDYKEAVKGAASGDEKAKSRSAQVLQELTTSRRAFVGELQIMPKGKGDEVARAIASRFPGSPWTVDDSGVGTSVLDHAKGVLRVDAEGISFSATPPDPLPGEFWCTNMRAALYVRAGMLVSFGLIDVPDDPLLRQEILAAKFKWERRLVTVTRDGRQVEERVDAVRIQPKEEIKQKIGRSPDRADAFVLAAAGIRTKFSPPGYAPAGAVHPAFLR